MSGGYVYMMSNKYHGTIYIGVTSDLIKRVWQHKEKLVEGFTKRYNLDKLVWFEVHESIVSAIESEKKLKNIYRQKKITIIESVNPSWVDLYPEITGERSCAVASQPAG
jgi:putative endonuclease